MIERLHFRSDTSLANEESSASHIGDAARQQEAKDSWQRAQHTLRTTRDTGVFFPGAIVWVRWVGADLRCMQEWLVYPSEDLAAPAKLPSAKPPPKNLHCEDLGEIVHEL